MIEASVIENIAELAKIELNDEQKIEMQKHIELVSNYADDLSGVNTDGVKATQYIIPTRDVLRDDVPGVEFSQEEALKNAPVAKKGHFAIPKVLG